MGFHISAKPYVQRRSEIILRNSRVIFVSQYYTQQVQGQFVKSHNHVYMYDKSPGLLMEIGLGKWEVISR